MPLFSSGTTLNGNLFVSTADKVVGNTTSETTGIGTGTGSVTIPANTLKVGNIVRVIGGGIYSTQTLTPGNLTIKVKLGTTVIASTTMTVLVGAVASAAFDLSSRIAVRTIGATASLAPVGGLNFATSAGARLFADLVNGGSAVSVDLTASQTVDVTFQWATGSTGNTLTVTSLQVLIS